MRVCVVQTSSIDDKRANLDAAGRLIGRAVVEDRPDLVLLPEVFAFQGGNPEMRLAAAEPVPGGEAYAFLQEQAARHRIVLHGGSYLERAGDRVFNTSVAFDRDAQIAVLPLKAVQPDNLVWTHQMGMRLFGHLQKECGVSAPYHFGLCRLLELLQRVLPNRLEHPVASLVTARYHQRLLH